MKDRAFPAKPRNRWVPLAAFGIAVGVAAGLSFPRPGVTAYAIVDADDVATPATPTGLAASGRAGARALAPDRVPRLAPGAIGTSATAFERAKSEDASLRDLYNGELRDLRWAPAMEGRIRDRFTPDQLAAAGVTELKLVDLQCRQTMCLVEFEFPAALRASLHAAGLDRFLSPQDHFLERTGRLSAMAMDVGRKPAASDGSVGERVTTLFAFSPEEIDPARYPAWVEKERALRNARQEAP